MDTLKFNRKIRALGGWAKSLIGGFVGALLGFVVWLLVCNNVEASIRAADDDNPLAGLGIKGLIVMLPYFLLFGCVVGAIVMNVAYARLPQQPQSDEI